MNKKPRIFIGSSTEGLEVAQALQYQLRQDADVILWNEGVFELTHNYLDSLLKATNDFDYAILVFQADDQLTARGNTSPVTRGNVVFELGLFLASLGIDRTFVVYDTHSRPAVISDLEGVVFAPFDSSESNKILSAVGPACFLIRQMLKKRAGGYEASRILFLGSNPIATAPLRLDREVRAITDGIRQLQKRGQVSLAQQWALRAEELDSVLQEYLPHFVHISCHGSENGFILEDRYGNPIEVSAHAVMEILKLFSDSIRCVLFTSGCSRLSAQTLVEAIDCVISLDGFMDESVVIFTTAFYQALGNAQDVQRAFDLARLRLAATGMTDEPKLYAKVSPNELTM